MKAVECSARNANVEKQEKSKKSKKNQTTGHNLKKVVDNKRVVCYNILRCPAGQFAVGG